MNEIIILFLTGVLSLFAGIFYQGKLSRYIGITGLLTALFFAYRSDSTFFTQYQAMFEFGFQASLFTKIVVFTTLLLFLLGNFAFNNHRSHQSELYSLILFSLCGAIVLFGARSLIMIFVGIEILSIPLYVMAGANKVDLRSTESSIKYFLTGAFATGFLLMGIALVYGSTGSFDLNQFQYRTGWGAMRLAGCLLILCSLAFKVGMVPFHMWSPDVYQGSPSIITAYMASVVKVAGFYTLFVVLTQTFGDLSDKWIQVVSSLIILTLLVGNLMGLVQKNAKRMLAYSSVSHAGYLALILYGFTTHSLDVLAYYLLAYSVATVGVFLCLIWVEKLKRNTAFEAFSGLASTEPLLAIATAISLMSMAGIPLTAGFMGKLGIFSQVIKGGGLVLVLVAVLGSAISIAYYLRLIIFMFFAKESSFQTLSSTSLSYKVVAILVIGILISLGISPELFQLLLNN